MNGKTQDFCVCGNNGFFIFTKSKRKEEKQEGCIFSLFTFPFSLVKKENQNEKNPNSSTAMDGTVRDSILAKRKRFSGGRSRRYYQVQRL